MAIRHSAFKEYQKNLIDKKVSDIVEILDKKNIERAQ